MRTFTKPGLLALLVFAAGCTIKETEAPPLSGPSELGLRLNLSLSHDSIYQDGATQTVLTIDATNGDGLPKRGLAMRIDITADGLPYDLGTLSTKTPVTGDDGKARVTYTAPPKEIEGLGHLVTFLVTPIGEDYRGEIARQVDLRLVPPGVILPPNGEPVPDFRVSPQDPKVMDVVNFDASPSTDEGVPCGMRCTYTWDFGDRTTATGLFVTHQFRDVSTYQVLLTVTDARGTAATVAKTVTVGAGTPPTAAFIYSPTSPKAGDTIFWSAQSSTAAPGRRIVSYEWNFGSGSFASGVTVSKGYNTPGTYKVELKVEDDAGQTAVASADVTVLPRP
jgi:PKD repeat protein